jgi:hypothetical protein
MADLRDPRKEKLRDFRHRGKHLHVGRKNCGVCFGWYKEVLRHERRKKRVVLESMRKRLSQ